MKNSLKPILVLFLIASIPNTLLAQENTRSELKKDGFYLGAGTGTWFGTGKNTILGNPLLFDLALELKSGRGSLAFSFDLITSISTTDTLYLKKDNDVLKADRYFGAQFGLEYSHELYSRNRFALEAIGGAGYGALSFKGAETKDYDKSSLYLNPGFGARYFVSDHTFIRLKLQYNTANYKLKDQGSTDISGNFITAKLILGWK
uniref:hypothetical protein n=1 Tax=Pedobacter schmidteae TaxID=2201271 RepID=UPI000EAE8E32|nr:hypothetical protein [Pedobacter schmidteae]